MSQKLQKPSDFFTLSKKLLETLTLHSGITDQFHSYAELSPPPPPPPPPRLSSGWVCSGRMELEVSI